jgi:hypothetical protein
MTITPPSLWVSTQHMAAWLGVHRVTLQRLKKGGFFRCGHHFRNANPLAPRSNTVWHQQRVLLRIDSP